MSFEETKSWYDGYGLVTHHKDGDIAYSMYSPKSVVEAMTYHSEEETVAIPNKEVSFEYVNAIRTMDWEEDCTCWYQL